MFASLPHPLRCVVDVFLSNCFQEHWCFLRGVFGACHRCTQSEASTRGISVGFSARCHYFFSLGTSIHCFQGFSQPDSALGSIYEGGWKGWWDCWQVPISPSAAEWLSGGSARFLCFTWPWCMVAENEIVMSFDFDVNVDFTFVSLARSTFGMDIAETARGLPQDVSDHVPCQRGLLPNHWCFLVWTGGSAGATLSKDAGYLVIYRRSWFGIGAATVLLTCLEFR